MDEKVIYSQKAPQIGNAKIGMSGFAAIALLIIVLLVVVNFLPYSGILTLVVFAFGAYLIHKLLNNAVFEITYKLFEDKLVFERKYGYLSWEAEVFPFDEARFEKDMIEHRGKKYDFYPDDELKKLLKIEII